MKSFSKEYSEQFKRFFPCSSRIWIPSSEVIKPRKVGPRAARDDKQCSCQTWHEPHDPYCHEDVMSTIQVSSWTQTDSNGERNQ